MRGKQPAPIVRVAANEAYQICFALDAGARGIIAPMINTRAEAEAMVRACRYFPLGNRSNAGVRGEWGEFRNYRDYMDAVNNELLIVPMIETNQALENLDDIASVPGMDPNFYVQKGFKFFTMPWGPWAQAGIQNALAGIKR